VAGPDHAGGQLRRLEQGLVDQASLDQPVGQAEHEHGRPASPGAAGHLADEDRAAAVQQGEDGQ
jgi:non-ribosomal peptide synthetase component E (peptide arylation enzyme)